MTFIAQVICGVVVVASSVYACGTIVTAMVALPREDSVSHEIVDPFRDIRHTNLKHGAVAVAVWAGAFYLMGLLGPLI